MGAVENIEFPIKIPQKNAKVEENVEKWVENPQKILYNYERESTLLQIRQPINGIITKKRRKMWVCRRSMCFL